MMDQLLNTVTAGTTAMQVLLVQTMKYVLLASTTLQVTQVARVFNA